MKNILFFPFFIYDYIDRYNRSIIFNCENCWVLRMYLYIYDVNCTNCHGNTILHEYVKRNDMEMIEMLIKDYNPDINIKNLSDYTAFDMAIFSKNEEIIKLLLIYCDIDVNCTDMLLENILMDFVKLNLTKSVEFILNEIDDINTQNLFGESALMLAVYSKNIEIFKLLLTRNDIDVNLKDMNGNTAFMLASYEGHIEMIKTFLEKYNIDINLQNRIGDTALMMASSGGYIEIVKILLKKYNIDINLQNRNCNTAFILATSKGYTEIVRMLLKRSDLNINLQNKNGDTAFMLASFGGSVEIVEMMLKRSDLDMNLKNKYDDTALTLAISGGYTKLVKLLLIKLGCKQ